MLERTMTLAAEIFAEDDDLRITGYRSPEFADISGRGRSVLIEGLGRFHVVEGDLLLDDDELALYVLRNRPTPPAPGVIMGDSELVGISVGNQPVRWDEGVVLRYCVLRESFPTTAQYDVARASLESAAFEWESICGVRFMHESALDDSPAVAASAPDIDPGLIFVARYLDSHGTFIASAFFPTEPPSQRKVYLDPAFFREDLRFDQIGVLRHELGHVLGFRHEHIRSGAPAECAGEPRGDLFPFGAYDPSSVMHYFCGGVGDPKLRFSRSDMDGARQLYGPPVGRLA